ncbi:ketopantoate reductase family protein [Roseateles depolymerans]|uniref:Putative oxidoreductase n=1 Tax=Roseateles depolymerans TaxID=76731 RepID=A0A0U3MNI7_9BURK|nr:2-dehydropantoate 2-reductase N-terminal domain-containing protein [Roseateles depolymerans]ALV05898.1 Putative oxidoreductase [Roseateles depolymerans]REG12829.1 2-dehydropantoate 2-reductase [Roseateles depolymerans]
MKVAIVGAGRIGSAFGYHLARGGHDVTLVARGGRLEELRREGGVIESIAGDRASVNVDEQLEPTTPWDLVLVTVLAHQVDAVLPALVSCRAATVMFMFNTFGELGSLRDVVGAHRTRFAFPNMISFFEAGKLRNVVGGPGMVTATDSVEWVERFKAAGMPAELRADMQSYLRSHVAFVVPLMAAAHMTPPQGPGVTWHQARQLATALKAGLTLVTELGHQWMPGFVVVLARLPHRLAAAMLWAFSRTTTNRDLARFGPDEVRSLIDTMAAAGPQAAAPLQAIRP